MHINDAAYLAGLFDGEGSIYFKKTRQKKHKRPGKPIHNVMVIRMEIAMTDKSVLEWVWKQQVLVLLDLKKFKKDTNHNGVGALRTEMR